MRGFGIFFLCFLQLTTIAFSSQFCSKKKKKLKVYEGAMETGIFNENSHLKGNVTCIPPCHKLLRKLGCSLSF